MTRIASGATTRRMIAGSLAGPLVVALGCTSPLVASDVGEADDDEAEDSGTASNGKPQPSDDDDAPSGDDDDGDATAAEGSGDGSNAGDASDDGPADGEGDSTDSGDVVACEEPQVPNVRAEVWPGSDPLEHAQILRELECVIDDRITAGDGVSFQMSCTKDGVPLPSSVVVGVEAEGITVPASLAVGVAVHARVYTGRDLDDIEAFPWRRADHFALYRDGVLVLGAGEGVSFPSTLEGEPFADFWSPVLLGGLPSTCPGDVLECHALVRGIWEVTANGTSVNASPFSVVQIADYEIHLGELVNADSPQCGEPPYGWLSFAIAPS